MRREATPLPYAKGSPALVFLVRTSSVSGLTGGAAGSCEGLRGRLHVNLVTESLGPGVHRLFWGLGSPIAIGWNAVSFLLCEGLIIRDETGSLIPRVVYTTGGEVSACITAVTNKSRVNTLVRPVNRFVSQPTWSGIPRNAVREWYPWCRYRSPLLKEDGILGFLD